MASDALSLTDVHAYYGDSHVLHGVSFSLSPGSVLALLGRNGAGKTTCISTIIGFLTPQAGEIRHGGPPLPKIPTINAAGAPPFRAHVQVGDVCINLGG